MSKNKLVTYYTPSDNRLGEYYLGHIKLLGLDKHPFGLDEHGTLRFESTDTNSKVWQRYRELGGSEENTGDLNTLWIEFAHKKFTLDEMMQFYRELGYSLCGFVDVWSERYYAIEDKREFEQALVELEGIEHFENAKQDFLENIFLAHLNGVEDEIVTKYRVEAKKIICANFGKDAWNEFVKSIQTKHER